MPRLRIEKSIVVRFRHANAIHAEIDKNRIDARRMKRGSNPGSTVAFSQKCGITRTVLTAKVVQSFRNFSPTVTGDNLSVLRNACLFLRSTKTVRIKCLSRRDAGVIRYMFVRRSSRLRASSTSSIPGSAFSQISRKVSYLLIALSFQPDSSYANPIQ